MLKKYTIISKDDFLFLRANIYIKGLGLFSISRNKYTTGISPTIRIKVYILKEGKWQVSSLHNVKKILKKAFPEYDFRTRK